MSKKRKEGKTKRKKRLQRINNAENRRSKYKNQSFRDDVSYGSSESFSGKDIAVALKDMLLASIDLPEQVQKVFSVGVTEIDEEFEDAELEVSNEDFISWDATLVFNIEEDPKKKYRMLFIIDKKNLDVDVSNTKSVENTIMLMFDYISLFIREYTQIIDNIIIWDRHAKWYPFIKRHRKHSHLVVDLSSSINTSIGEEKSSFNFIKAESEQLNNYIKQLAENLMNNPNNVIDIKHDWQLSYFTEERFLQKKAIDK